MVRTVASRFGAALAAWLHPPASQLGAGNASQKSSENLFDVVPGLSLSARFAFAATIVLCNGMALLGGWVVREIEKGMLQTLAAEESVYVQGLFEPIVPKLLGNTWTPDEASRAGDQILKSAMLGNRLAAVAVWRPDGVVSYSTDRDLIGQKFPLTAEIQAALKGEIRTSLWDKRLYGVYRKRPNEIPVRTIYAPLRDPGTNAIVAVAELADNAEPSKSQLDGIRRRTWIVVGIATLLMIMLLFSIVHQGSRTIDEQRRELQSRYDEQARLAQLNKTLNERLQDSNRHGIELGEQLLRRIGMGLQDGPVQMLALALLRMNELKQTTDKSKGQKSLQAPSAAALEVIELATNEALKEIRAIEASLVLPELRQLSPHETLETAILAHERVTGSQVERDIANLPPQVPLPIAICIFRIAEEGLSNAFRHAGGLGQKLTARGEGKSITLILSDNGPGMSRDKQEALTRNLGLRGLSQRVVSIGGTFDIHSEAGKGTQLRAWIPCPEPVVPIAAGKDSGAKGNESGSGQPGTGS